MQGKAEVWGTKIVEGRVIGRDCKVVPPQEVEDLAMLGCKNNEICDWFGIDKSTLIRNFERELIKGRENLKHSLRRAQLKAALGGNVVMLIWLGKNMLGQSDSGIVSDDNQPLPWIMSDIAEELPQEKQDQNETT